MTLAAYFIGHYMESGVWEIANSPDGMTMAFLTMSMAEIFHSLQHAQPARQRLHTRKLTTRFCGAPCFSAWC